MKNSASLLYNKVHQAANESLTHSALYYAVLWGYTEIIASLLEEAKSNHIDIQDAMDLARGAAIPSPEPNCLRMFCKTISTCCLNIKMYYFRRNELDELLCNYVLLDTLDDLRTAERYDPPPPPLPIEQEITKQPIIVPGQIIQKHKTRPTPPIGVPRIKIELINIETEYKSPPEPICLTNYTLHKPISRRLKARVLDPNRRTAPKPPIGVPRIKIGLKMKKHAGHASYEKY